MGAAMKKILIIEDEENILFNIKYLLEVNGFETITARDGEEGFNIAKKTLPDLIISDIMMPVADGYALKSKLNENDQTALIPFIFLTAKAEMNDMRSGMNLGADDYLVKPFKSADLLKAIEIRLKKAGENGKKPSDLKHQFKNDGRIFIDVRDKQIFIKINEIKYIRAVGAYTEIYSVEEKKFLIRKLLKEWEEVLPEENFLRIHRSIIINLDHVAKVEKWFNRSYKVYLTGSTPALDISQRYAVKLKNKLSI